MLASLGVLDVSATRQMHSNSSMLAIAEAGGHSPSLAEAGEVHHLTDLGDLEGTSLSQGLTACKRNKHNSRHFFSLMFYIFKPTNLYSILNLHCYN